MKTQKNYISHNLQIDSQNQFMDFNSISKISNQICTCCCSNCCCWFPIKAFGE